ncbi:ABC transporter ATP-binding protein [Evansella sp. LMS18]|uniref:ATP-binding cassette domain-containing protein n=1 Tax=Evansella sp. LMS18 TaxID=2924033 RepID=UPI0020D173AC|nr:ABC transporter ATP-binding protein [Evansella sp. LMS18]UTR12182.1 ABC transporter ATP-binding protein [Evansella sp. LMS18]
MIKFDGVQKNIDRDVQIGPLDFYIEPGTVTALVGNNGAGKSTLIRMLTDMVFPDTGTITRFGKVSDPAGREDEVTWKEQIAYVPQTSIGYERFSLKQLAELQEIGFSSWDWTEFHRLAERFSLPLKKRFDSLSTGMQKKGLLLLALSRSSKFLVMDEPLSGVDIESQEIIREEWVSYLEQDPGRAILFSTHIPEEVKGFADYVVCMKEGALSGRFEKDSLQENYARLWVSAGGSVSQEEIIRNLPGVIDVKRSGNNCEIITENLEQTENALAGKNIEIVLQQGLEFSEILRTLLKNREEKRTDEFSA